MHEFKKIEAQNSKLGSRNSNVIKLIIALVTLIIFVLVTHKILKSAQLESEQQQQLSEVKKKQAEAEEDRQRQETQRLADQLKQQKEREIKAELEAQAIQLKLVEKPSYQALYDLFGVIGDADKGIKIDAQHLVTKWYDKYFEFNNEQFHSVFFQAQSVNENGKLLSDCHSCGAELHIVTYKLINNKWERHSALNDVELGGFGELPQFDDAIFYNLSNHSIIMAVNGSYMAQGVVTSYQNLLGFNQNGWQYLGVIDIAENSYGNCEEKNINCFYDYKGEVSFLPFSEKEVFPDIVLKKTGTYYDEGKILPVKDDRYHFDGKEYVIVDALPAVTIPFNRKDATFSDNNTGLEWMRCAMGQTWTGSTCSGKAKIYTWQKAMTLKTNFEGKDDWKLPTRDQLATLVYCSKGKKEGDGYNDYSAGCLESNYQKPTIDILHFPNTFSGAFWSSLNNYYGDESNKNTAWYVDFSNGSYDELDKSKLLAVRLVRVRSSP